MATQSIANIVAVGQSLVTRYGTSIQLVDNSRTPTDPAQPWLGNTNTVTQSVTMDAVFVEPSSSERLGDMDEIIDFVRNSDLVCVIVPGVGFDTDPYDTLIRDGVEYRIDEKHVLKPGDEVGCVFLRLSK